MGARQPRPGTPRRLIPALLLSSVAGLLVSAAVPGTAQEIPGRGETPAAFRELAGREWPAGWGEASVITLFDSTRVKVEPTGLTHRHRRRLVKVVDEAGALELASLRFDYDPASNLIELRRVRVHRAGGRYEDLDPAVAADVYAPAHSIYWGARMKVIALPRLRPGDLVETITYKKGFLIAYLLSFDRDPPRRDGDAGAERAPEPPPPDGRAGQGEEDERYIPPMRGHFYDTVLFGESQPFHIKHYAVELPREKPLHVAVYNEAVFAAQAFTDSSLVYRWWALDRPAVDGEPRQASWNDFVAKVVMATVPDWPAKSRWFFEVNEPVFAWNEPIQAKVDELIRGLESDEARWAALTHWVADNIRYSGLNMGEGEGYTIHPSRMTWEDRCGVCKDIAGMLVTFLRAAGYTSYPAMTMAGARVERVPADQFNHCVVAVEAEDGSYVMLDPTWVGHSRDLWSKAEGEQHYVIGSPEGEDLCAIRGFAAEESPLEVRLRTRVRENGDLTGTARFEARGYLDGRLRRQFLFHPADAWDSRLAALLAPIGEGLVVTGSRYGDIHDYGEPMRCEAEFRIPGYAAVTDSTIDLGLPALRLLAGSGAFVRLLGVAAGGDRRHPANFWAPSQVSIEAELALPERYAFEPLPPTCDLAPAAATFECGGELSGRTLAWSLRLALTKRTVAPDEWAGLAAVADTVATLAARRWSGRR